MGGSNSNTDFTFFFGILCFLLFVCVVFMFQNVSKKKKNWIMLVRLIRVFLGFLDFFNSASSNVHLPDNFHQLHSTRILLSLSR